MGPGVYAAACMVGMGTMQRATGLSQWLTLAVQENTES